MRARPLVLTGLIAGAVCVLIAVVSGSPAPALITAVPTGAPPVDVEVTPLGPESVPTMGALPELRGVGDIAVAGNVLNILGVILAIAVALMLILVALRVAHQLSSRESVEPIGAVVVRTAVDADELQHVLRRAREQIDLDADANRAVIRCWEALEALGAEAGVVRDESQTATEYVLGILQAFDVPAEAATRLSALYGRALFSAERLPDVAIANARDALTQLERALAAPSRAPEATR